MAQVQSAEKTYREMLADANINPETCLATDYLNHFNEILMLLDLVGDMPEMLEEAGDWRPKSYCDHFRDSAFVGKDLVIEAWGEVESDLRTEFEIIVGQLNLLVISTIRIMQRIAAGERVRAGLAEENRVRIQALLASLNGLIHEGLIADEVEPDSEWEVAETGEGAAQSQDEIDRLFED